MAQVQRRCVCGRSFWPKQAWIHEGCLVRGGAPSAFAQTPKPVVNAAKVVNASVVVNKRSGRHRKTEARAKYMREYMKRRRAAG